MTELREILGKNVKYYRDKLDLTQEEAAAVCDISEKYIGKIERVEQAASIDIIWKISIGFGISAERLLMKEIPEETDNDPDGKDTQKKKRNRKRRRTVKL